MLQAINAVLEKLSERLAVVVGWALLGLTALITVEVFGRKLFNFSTQGADEIGGYVLAIIVSSGLAYALYQKAHVRIEVLLVKAPLSLQGISTLTTMALLGAYAWFLAWRAMGVAIDSLMRRSTAPTPLQTPLIIPHTIWALTLGIFAVAVSTQLIEAVFLSLRRDWVQLGQKFGIRSVTEELEEEISDFKARSSSEAKR